MQNKLTNKVISYDCALLVKEFSYSDQDACLLVGELIGQKGQEYLAKLKRTQLSALLYRGVRTSLLLLLLLLLLLYWSTEAEANGKSGNTEVWKKLDEHVQVGQLSCERSDTSWNNHVGRLRNKAYKLDLVQNGRTWNKLEQFEHGISLMEEWEAWCAVKQELASHMEQSAGG